jgi:hypothetical protein
MRSIAVGSCGMAFGQSAGPPASGRQLSELVELLEAAGHSDFRDARGPMGFNQRQAGGKFTQEEAEAFIEQLQSEVYGDGPPADSKPSAPARVSKIAPRPTTTAPKKRKKSTPGIDLTDLPAELLAAELQRRGWVVLEP